MQKLMLLLSQTEKREFCHSDDTINLKGSNEKAKANIAPVVGKLIQIANNKVQYSDYGNRHKTKAKHGWYRYDTRFGIPVYDERGELIRYNIFSVWRWNIENTIQSRYNFLQHNCEKEKKNDQICNIDRSWKDRLQWLIRRTVGQETGYPTVFSYCTNYFIALQK